MPYLAGCEPHGHPVVTDVSRPAGVRVRRTSGPCLQGFVRDETGVVPRAIGLGMGWSEAPRPSPGRKYDKTGPIFFYSLNRHKGAHGVSTPSMASGGDVVPEKRGRAGIKKYHPGALPMQAGGDPEGRSAIVRGTVFEDGVQNFLSFTSISGSRRQRLSSTATISGVVFQWQEQGGAKSPGARGPLLGPASGHWATTHPGHPAARVGGSCYGLKAYQTPLLESPAANWVNRNMSDGVEFTSHSAHTGLCRFSSMSRRSPCPRLFTAPGDVP